MSTTKEHIPCLPGKKWHNPDNITAEQLGDGFRLLLPEEVDGRHASIAEVWDRHNVEWGHAATAVAEFCTYRVPISTPLLDGWIVWTGGKKAPCILHVDVIFSDMDTDTNNARDYRWSHERTPSDIIFFRTVKELAELKDRMRIAHVTLHEYNQLKAERDALSRELEEVRSAVARLHAALYMAGSVSTPDEVVNEAILELDRLKLENRKATELHVSIDAITVKSVADAVYANGPWPAAWQTQLPSRVNALVAELSALKSTALRWISASEGKPTKADADENGHVAIRYRGQHGGIHFQSWHYVRFKELPLDVFWLPLAGAPPHKPKEPTLEEKERADFEAWWNDNSNDAPSWNLEVTWRAWQAARAQKGGQQ